VKVQVERCAGPTVKVQVERCAGHLGIEMPVRFRFDAREVEIVETVDQWYGSDYCYLKIKDKDGNLYILRFDEGRAEWELMMFQSPGPIRRTILKAAGCRCK
jgi:hypothetical protein